MPYLHKKEPLNDNKVSRLINVCDTSGEKLVAWRLLDTGSGLSEFAGPKKRSLPECSKPD